MALDCLYFLLFVWMKWELATSDLVTSFRGLYDRHSEMKLSSLPRDQINQVTVEECARRCVTEVLYECKSFDYNNKRLDCLLFSTSLDDPDVRLIDTIGTDHYQTAYVRLFARTPQHQLSVPASYEVRGLTVESCSRLCVLERQFKCVGFNYRTVPVSSATASQQTSAVCQLLEKSVSTSTGIVISLDTDYYLRKPEGALSQFFNMGMGRLLSVPGETTYQSEARSNSLNDCASLCLSETRFTCASFDYTYSNKLCQMSKFLAANVNGLDTRNANNLIVNHFEKIGDSMAFFYPTPYSILIGNDMKTYSQVTANYCAQMCIKEESFVCRSFDYEVRNGVCSLSGKTGSDVGGLYTDYTQQIHHFEMKPILDCGGNLTAPSGDFASPNWPRSYIHNERCTWIIRTPRNKVVHLYFTHLAMSAGDCNNQREDRLLITERGQRPYCILPNTKTIISKTNELNVTFITNSFIDAQGFRAFYSAEWTCDAFLFNSPGEIASPGWPEYYPSSVRCAWRIISPDGTRIKLTFTLFELEKHSLGHCNDQSDHVKILDGGTVSSPVIGLYCGSQSPLTVRSSRRDLIVQFTSDNSVDNQYQGFHATFVFETLNGSVITTYDGNIEGKFVQLDAVKKTNQTTTSKYNQDYFNNADIGAQSAVGAEILVNQPEDHGDYRRTMTAVIATLVMMLLATAMVVLLLWRHYRKKFIRHEQSVRFSTLANDTLPLRYPNSRDIDMLAASALSENEENLVTCESNISNNLRELYSKDTNLRQVNVVNTDCKSKGFDV